MSSVEFSTFTPQAEDSLLRAFQRFAGQFDDALNPNPGAWSRKVVIHGSSVAAGSGASPATNGWAYLLAARLVALGDFTVTNVAVGGTTSAQAVSTFYSRVVVEKPDIVVIGLSFRNDGMASASTTAARNAIYDAYLANILQLVEMCRQMDYDVVVGGVYPSDEYSAEVFPYLVQFDRDMESMGIPYICFRRGVDDGTGHWQTGYKDDDAHPDTDGHAAMAACIPDGLLVRDPLSVARLGLQSRQALGDGHLFASDATTAAPIKHVWDSAPVKSFTAAVWVKGGTDLNSKSILALSDGARIRNLTSGTTNLQLVTPGGTVLASSGVSGSDGSWHHVAIVYRASTTTLYLYVDGALIGSGTYDASAVTYVSVGGRPSDPTGNAINGTWRHYGFWRGELSATEISALVNGLVPSGGCEIFCPMDDPEVKEGGRFRNLGTSTGYLLMQQSGGSTPA